MANWISKETHLVGPSVDLIPLEESHFTDLLALARDERIWQYYTYDGANPERLKSTLINGLMERERGTQFPFVIFMAKTKKDLLEVHGSWIFNRFIKNWRLGPHGCTMITGDVASIWKPN